MKTAKSYATPTTVINMIVLAIMFLAARNHATIAHDTAAAAALFVWSVVNFFTSKGGKGVLSMTVLVNGIAALLAVVSAIAGWHISPEEMEVLVSVLGGANLLGVEGSFTHVAMKNAKRE